MDKKTPIPSDYAMAFEAIKKRVRVAQYDALKAVNKQLINLLLGYLRHDCPAAEGTWLEQISGKDAFQGPSK